MPRFTDTRAEVRRIARELSRAGGTPTPTVVREMLGRGSMNTVVDELRRWRAEEEMPHRERTAVPAAEQSPARPAVEDVKKLVSLQQVTDLLSSVQSMAREQSGELSSLREVLVEQSAAAGRLGEMLGRVVRVLETTENRHAEDLNRVTAELNKLSARLDGVQKHMLLQIAEARETASVWKDKHTALKREHAIWRDTLQSQVLRLTEELAHVKGRSGVPLKAGAAEVVATATLREDRLLARPVQQLEARASNYPGHPRAGSGWDEHTE